ncbi:hypothetical protein [Curtobacterium sp. YR515]|uniref:hypothetical protein n=1 Tax=Curtobacterium sp. YR515 TaxID=1855316 RepID=UPI0008F0F29C|nr:hypothetical protein [Curtobacterium sp. YR515]SFF84069.1 hypothetical protein SAMN05216329_2873 [Curtobacterium sp. YR515]
MIDDSNATYPADPVPSGTGSDRLPRVPCLSVFDRWRCGLADGHAGHHESVVSGSVTRWNEGITGRRLQDL